jgi:hypothetical protein
VDNLRELVREYSRLFSSKTEGDRDFLSDGDLPLLRIPELSKEMNGDP